MEITWVIGKFLVSQGKETLLSTLHIQLRCPESQTLEQESPSVKAVPWDK